MLLLDVFIDLCLKYNKACKFFIRITELLRQRCGVKGRSGDADRKVPAQPNVFIGGDGKVSRYNLRKFGELPFHLIRAGR